MYIFCLQVQGKEMLNVCCYSWDITPEVGTSRSIDVSVNIVRSVLLCVTCNIRQCCWYVCLGLLSTLELIRLPNTRPYPPWTPTPGPAGITPQSENENPMSFKWSGGHQRNRGMTERPTSERTPSHIFRFTACIYRILSSVWWTNTFYG